MGDVFRALADPTRRAIVDALAERDGQTLFELCSRLSMGHYKATTRQAVSQHLGVLEDAGLIHVRRQGRYKLHDLDLEPLEAAVSRWLPAPPAATGTRPASPLPRQPEEPA
ncbi:MAG TPA: metalloregulator ArsR/SmtB family transcription factor [Candidatus Limnocylindrales bacterium]|nr:metalloregulator ArsR/SmtB family transcription factor [Candidatus Limnocylindrales bacterium]